MVGAFSVLFDIAPKAISRGPRRPFAAKSCKLNSSVCAIKLLSRECHNSVCSALKRDVEFDWQAASL